VALRAPTRLFLAYSHPRRAGFGRRGVELRSNCRSGAQSAGLVRLAPDAVHVHAGNRRRARPERPAAPPPPALFSDALTRSQGFNPTPSLRQSETPVGVYILLSRISVIIFRMIVKFRLSNIYIDIF
jgi:hypothetical protein